jgi:DNA-directed RNA polymerase subunit RPC12/RpoP
MGDYHCENCQFEFDIDIMSENDDGEYQINHCPNCGLQLFFED